jgi:hypothetical protein
MENIESFDAFVNEAKDLSKKEVRDLKVKINNASTIGKYFTKDEVKFLTSLFESEINEAKKFYNRKEIIKISKLAGDFVLDAKDDIQHLAVSFGNKVPSSELEKVLVNYDLDLEDVNEANDEDKPYFDFLLALRDSGATNMFGATPYLQSEFGLSKSEARKILAKWMKSF